MLSEFVGAFILGLLTPLTALCVLPLYPGFITYLSNRTASPYKVSLAITIGLVLFMGLLGLIFTFILQISITKIVQLLSPIAFMLLALISLLLIFNIDFSKYLPSINSPKAKNPYIEGLLFGLFFGAIILPCNPGFIAALFAKTTLSAAPTTRIGEFLFFAIGISMPLHILAALSTSAQSTIIKFLTHNKRIINAITGLFMLAISLYYLFFVFNIL